MSAIEDTATQAMALRWVLDGLAQHRGCSITDVIADLDDPKTGRTWQQLEPHLGVPVTAAARDGVLAMLYAEQVVRIAEQYPDATHPAQGPIQWNPPAARLNHPAGRDLAAPVQSEQPPSAPRSLTPTTRPGAANFVSAHRWWLIAAGVFALAVVLDLIERVR